jgi:predicted nucleotide-binding protein (sugar kinase/HSP70/actin superfamily)
MSANKWYEYEREKARISVTSKSAEEYEQRVKELAKKLKI